MPLPPILGGGRSPINPSFPILDPGLGFRLGFELQIITESHDNSNRAGFSVILLGEDLKGVEIGFWGDRIWAQSDTFTHAESAGFDTITNEVSYELTIQGMDYYLTGNGSSILSGTTHYYGDYLTGFPDPYEVPSFLFLGDDTDSAFASFTLGTVTLEHDLQLPAPPIWPLLLVGLAVIRTSCKTSNLTQRL